MFPYSVVWLMPLQAPLLLWFNAKELLCSMLATSGPLNPLGHWCFFPE